MEEEKEGEWDRSEAEKWVWQYRGVVPATALGTPQTAKVDMPTTCPLYHGFPW